MDTELVAAVRRFNRTVTQRVGALDDEYMARGRPLAQARLLWEISPDGTEVAVLRARLGLDSGYLSRLLRTLSMVVFEPCPPSDPRARACVWAYARDIAQRFDEGFDQRDRRPKGWSAGRRPTRCPGRGRSAEGRRRSWWLGPTAVPAA
jgi:hypothetical protein